MISYVSARFMQACRKLTVQSVKRKLVLENAAMFLLGLIMIRTSARNHSLVQNLVSWHKQKIRAYTI
jgi:hypothetical protein